MAKTAQDFINQYSGKVDDYDGVYGAQCVDGFKRFCQWIGAPVLPTKTGWADGYWKYRIDYSNYVTYITDPNKLKKGDWLFWAKGSSCPASHVAMFVRYNGAGYADCFGQNQGGNGGYTTVRLKLDILGAFRFNALGHEGGTAMWKQDSTGWWWQNADGSYPVNKWQKINGAYYHFDNRGYMQTGWLNLGTEKAPKWYWLDTDGARRQSTWAEVNDKWYYFDKNGLMLTGWIHYKNGNGVWNWYYCDSSGAMVTGTRTVKAKFNSNGELVR